MTNPVLVVLFHRFGPYHHARLNAVSRLTNLLAVEFSGVDNTYAWDKVDKAQSFRHLTLFQNTHVEEAPAIEIRHRVDEMFHEIKPSVVAIPGWSSKGALAVLSWCNRHGVPCIVMSDSTEHDAIRKTWKEIIKSRVVLLCSAGFVGGQAHVDYLALLGMSRERIFTGYDVVDNQHFSFRADKSGHDADTIRAKLGLPRYFFLASNRFIEEKNLSRLLEAYARYRNQAGSAAWTLILLGDGRLKSKLQDLVNQYDLARWVSMPGFKQYDDLPAYYALAGAFIHASIKDTWGLVVNEAMAAGLPVIVSNRCGCAPDLVEEGRNGYTFDPYNVPALVELMLKVAADDCDRAAMGETSREIISRWTPQFFAENLCKAMETALLAPRPKPNLFDKALLEALIRR